MDCVVTPLKTLMGFSVHLNVQLKFYQDLNAANGLAGNLRYNEVTPDQLKQLQKYMRELNLVSKELFDKYEKEY